MRLKVVERVGIVVLVVLVVGTIPEKTFTQLVKFTSSHNYCTIYSLLQRFVYV